MCSDDVHRNRPRNFPEGVGVSILGPQIAALAVIGVVVLTLSKLRFHKALD